MKVSYVVLTLLLYSNPVLVNAHAISYKLNGGRLGDCIYSFCLAKWLAYKYKIPFYYIPFKGVDDFSIGLYEKRLTKEVGRKFKKVISIHAERDLASYLKKEKQQALFLVHFHAAIDVPREIEETDQLMVRKVGTNWIYLLMKKHPSFEAEIKRDVQLRKKPQPFNLPKRMITMAVHVRKGGGFDAPQDSSQYVSKHGHFRIASDRVHPLKFPPEQYYVDQITKVSDMLDNMPIFACIFTDDPSPELLIERFEQKIKRPNIKFICAQSGHNAFQENILDDVYQMSRFDCLIKSSSHFAWVSQLMGAHKIIVYPQLSEWDKVNKMISIVKVGIFFNEGHKKGVIYMPFASLKEGHQKMARHLFAA
ncbi:MAG: hypothetical protein WCW33_00140 [Candidatus Babeliales bacterium]